jgi:hypothetical protein
MVVIPEFTRCWILIIFWITLEEVDGTFLGVLGCGFTTDKVKPCECKDDECSKATDYAT